MIIEVKNSVVVSLVVVFSMLIALLPGAVVFWVLLGVPIVVFIFLFGSQASKNKGASIAFGILLLALVLALVFKVPAVMLIGWLFIMLMAGIALLVFPTAVNLSLSYLATLLLPKRYRQILFIPFFLLVSLVLAFNVRIPGMLDDWFNAKQAQQGFVTRVVQISQNEPLLVVTNVKQVVSRNSPYEVIGLRGNELWCCTHWAYPAMRTEEVDEVLLRSGIRYKKSGTARYKLVIDAREKGDHVLLEMSLWDGSEKTASQKMRLRSTYPYEEAFTNGRKPNLDYLPHRLLFLMQNNLWNYLLFSTAHVKDIQPVRDFLTATVNLITYSRNQESRINAAKIEGEIEHLKTYLPHVRKQIYVDPTGPSEVECGDAIRAQYELRQNASGWFSGTTITFQQAHERFSMFVTPELERVACTENAVYAIGTLAKQEIYIQKFSRRGEPLAGHIVSLPPITYEGLPRKRIIDFRDSGESYEFTVLDLSEESYYYAVKGAYLVRAPYID